jgi:hypothetical protein
VTPPRRSLPRRPGGACPEDGLHDGSRRQSTVVTITSRHVHLPPRLLHRPLRTPPPVSVATMSYETDTYDQRDSARERSPRRRSRSPRRSRRSYSPRSRSRSREDYRRNERRSRSPVGGGGAGGYQSYGSSRGEQARSVDPASKETMMQSIRESSQQDRRVYVGNLSYDVKWHHLKDFMRQGMVASRVWGCAMANALQPVRSCSQTYFCCRMECQR